MMTVTMTERALDAEIMRRDGGDRRGRQLDVAETGRARRLTLEILSELPTDVVARLIVRARERATRRRRDRRRSSRRRA